MKTVKILAGILALLLLLTSCRGASLQPPNSRTVPILMYHDFVEDDAGTYQITAKEFQKQLKTIRSRGYTTVTFEDLIRYVDGEGTLPEKCVVITADDGYTSVLELAMPLCEKYDMKMSAAFIGSLAGEGNHFDPRTAQIPERLELVSHTYDLHSTGMVNGETEDALEEMIRADTEKMAAAFSDCAPMVEKVLVYPLGQYTAESEQILEELGIRVTVTSDVGFAKIRRGDADSLRCLPRFYMTGNMSRRMLKSLLP